MRTRRIIFSSLLLVVATMFNAVFAQSAEEAAKYGQLQEIQLTKAGQLSKFIKKEDPSVTALKLSGEFNAKDWEILFSLPNIAYLDLWDAKNIAPTYEWKEGKEKKSMELIKGTRNLTPMRNLSALKFLAVPSATDGIAFSENTTYTLDMLVPNSKGVGISPNISFEKLREKESINRDAVFGDEILKFMRKNGIEMEDMSDNNKVGCKVIYETTPTVNTFLLYFIRPEEVVIEPTGQRLLNRYASSQKIVDLSSYHAIAQQAFAGTDVEEVNLGQNITEIPEGCFLNCKKLRKLTMPAVTKIGNYAFSGTEQLQEIKVNSQAESFNLGSVVCCGVKKVDLTEFSYAPELISDLDSKSGRRGDVGSNLDCKDKWANVKNDIEFMIPAGARSHRYNVGDWKVLRVVEYGAQNNYTFQLDSVGSLKNFITDDNALNIRSLTLKGVMDETEFELVRKCKYLKYLDMTNCFTFASVEVQKGKAAADIFLLQLLSLGSSMDREKKEQQYAHYETSYNEVQKAQVRDNFIKSLGIDDVKMEDLDAIFGHGKVIVSSECYFPEGAFEGLKELEEIHFPNKLLRLERKNLYLLRGASKNYKNYIQHLKKVRVSNELHTLGDYLFAFSPLEDINIPDSLKYVGYSCFKECKLKKVDLSNTQITTYHFYSDRDYPDMEVYIGDTKSIGLPLYAFYGTQLEELRLPKSLTKAEWIGDQLSDNNTARSNEIVIYVYFKEPFCKVGQFEEAYGKIKEIHIPRGMKAAWRGYPNVIDDIDLGE